MSKLSAKMLLIKRSVSRLSKKILTVSIQLRGMYIILTEILFLKTKEVRNKVRKWPNLCYVSLGMFRN